MLKSILVTAFRNILRNRSFSLINLIGLSVSMSLGLLIITIIKEQYAFDKFHADGDRIFRVNTRALRANGGSEDYASVPLPIAEALHEDYDLTDNIVTMNRSLHGDAVFGNVNVPIEGLLVDPSFLTVFNFPLATGNPSTALTEANGIVLTQDAAYKIFGQTEPLGQTLSIGNLGSFKVTGVLSKLPGKTHLEFEALVSMAMLPLFEKQGVMSKTSDNWNNYYSNYVYFKLKEGRDVSEASHALDEIARKHYSNLALETRDRGYEFFLLPLTQLTPGPVLSNQMGRGLPRVLIILLSSLAAIVMVMACFNYTNLMIAKSLSRAREIGVRKVIGARRWQVFVQFIGEAVLFSLLALMVSYMLLQLLKPAFMQLHITQEFSVNLDEDLYLLLYFVVFAGCVGIVAGALPAGYLSAFKPVKVLKDGANQRLYSRLTFRKALMVAQFTLSIIFILVVSVIYRQINFMFTKDYGITEENVVNIRLQTVSYEQLANALSTVSGVERIGFVSHALGTWADRSSDYKRTPDEEPFVMRDFMVDGNYLTNIGVEFLAGRNFDVAGRGANEREVILNETALTQFSFGDPHSAIGQTLYVGDSIILSVIGVVKDFNFRPLNYAIGPLALRYNPTEAGYLSMRIVPQEKEAVVAALHRIWKQLDPIHPLEWMMMADEIDKAYTDAGFTDVLKIVGYITFLVVTLACLGMLGMAMYSAQTRIKEIGVRKVMGADVSDITLLLSRSFLLLIVIATLIAVPIGLYLSNSFLNIYAFKVSIPPSLILFGVMLVMALGVITIGSQTLRAALANPVNALRYE